MKWAIVPLLWCAVPLAAQQVVDDECSPADNSNEARTMAHFGVPLAFSAATAPARPAAGRLQVGLELTYLPNIDPNTTIPTTCRTDKHSPENTDLLFAAPRPRVALGLPGGFQLEASWIPPIRMSEVKANLVGVALSRTFALSGSERPALLELRAHGTFGVIKAPITCDDAALQDANSPCYQGQRSNDSFKPNIIGISASLGWSAGHGFFPYAGAGYNHLAPRFRVNFTNQFDVLDRRLVRVDLERAVLFAGATFQPRGRLELSGEIYSAPVDAVTGRVMLRVKI